MAMSEKGLPEGRFFLGPIELPGGVRATIDAPAAISAEAFDAAIRALGERIRAVGRWPSATSGRSSCPDRPSDRTGRLAIVSGTGTAPSTNMRPARRPGPGTTTRR
jgi:hypothetical protein